MVKKCLESGSDIIQAAPFQSPQPQARRVAVRAANFDAAGVMYSLTAGVMRLCLPRQETISRDFTKAATSSTRSLPRPSRASALKTALCASAPNTTRMGAAPNNPFELTSHPRCLSSSCLPAASPHRVAIGLPLTNPAAQPGWNRPPRHRVRWQEVGFVHVAVRWIGEITAGWFKGGHRQRPGTGQSPPHPARAHNTACPFPVSHRLHTPPFRRSFQLFLSLRRYYPPQRY